MKHHKIWLLLAPIILFWLAALLIVSDGNDGTLESEFLRTKVYPRLSSLSGSYTDFKFRTRGERPVQENIVILDIDDPAVTAVGRWPWHRDAIAELAMSAIESGAKVVGLDIVFPEDDVRVSPELVEFMTTNGLGDFMPNFETDPVLQRVISLYQDKLVLGWMSDSTCQPAYDGQGCRSSSPEAGEFLPDGFDKFGFDEVKGAEAINAISTQITSAPTVVGNLPTYNQSAAYSGFLVSAVAEPDEVVRRAQLVLLVDGKPYPSLPLVMAGIGREEPLEIKVNKEGLVDHIGFSKTGEHIPVSPTGTLSMNFRGGGYSVSYVSALDIFLQEPEIAVQQGGKITMQRVEDIFKDAYVLIGVSAIGANDLKSFPFGNNILGTEGLATILDNILAGDPIRPSRGIWNTTLLFLLMSVGAVLFCLAMIRLSALPAVSVSLLIIGLIALFDTYYVFGSRDVNLPTVFLLAQLSTTFLVVLIVKYLAEERRKKIVRGTFSKYLAPAVVAELLKDPENIKLGGEAKELTIMMSDLRGFTATSERLSAERVLEMLNHYLGTMADIIVDYEGTIDEFIGDAILVIFGAPVSKEDDARRAVACCLAMQKAMAAVNEHNTAKGLPPLEMGIALNTGEVTVGNIGSQRRLKYGVVGSHVNLTARIESNTVGGQLLISESTLKLAGEDIKLGEKYSIVAKGFPDPIVAYEILGIGGEYDLFLDEVDFKFATPDKPVKIRYRIMKSKNDEGEEKLGSFSSLSTIGAILDVEEKLEALSNIKMRIEDESGELIEGDLYAKVVRGGDNAKLHFTAIPPEVETELLRLSKSELEESASSSEMIERD